MHLTDEQIQVLNDARTILAGLRTDDWSSTAQARVEVRAEIAENAIFQVLSTMNIWLHVPMTEKQVHNELP